MEIKKLLKQSVIIFCHQYIIKNLKEKKSFLKIRFKPPKHIFLSKTLL